MRARFPEATSCWNVDSAVAIAEARRAAAVFREFGLLTNQTRGEGLGVGNHRGAWSTVPLTRGSFTFKRETKLRNVPTFVSACPLIVLRDNLEMPSE